MFNRLCCLQDTTALKPRWRPDPVGTKVWTEQKHTELNTAYSNKASSSLEPLPTAGRPEGPCFNLMWAWAQVHHRMSRDGEGTQNNLGNERWS